MSKFGAIKRASKARESQPVSTPERAVTAEEKAEAKPKKRGRPKGKRSNPAFTQVTAYMRKDTYKNAQKALLDEDEEFSELVEDLVSKWLKSRS